MSTSCDPAWKLHPGPGVRKFQYPVIPAGMKPANPETESRFTDPSWLMREKTILEGQAAAIHAAREEAKSEVEAKSNLALERAAEQYRSQVAKLAADFSQQRGEYFRRVESEVVALALAITRKILHRECQLDPLLLRGAVHVALERMQSLSGIVLKVSSASLPLWQKSLLEEPHGEQEIELVADPELEADHCILSCEIGSTEIDLQEQVKEIETGFFDLLASRPGTSA